jgi:hypothetical protein
MPHAANLVSAETEDCVIEMGSVFILRFQQLL